MDRFEGAPITKKMMEGFEAEAAKDRKHAAVGMAFSGLVMILGLIHAILNFTGGFE